MAKATLKSVSKLMAGLDFGMLTTVDGRGTHFSRPMSNNGNVDYDGTSYFFCYANSQKVKHIKKNPIVSLQFVNPRTIRQNVFVHISGKAKLSTDRELMEKYWVVTNKLWFPEGLDTKGITLLTVKATSVHYWNGTDEGIYSPSKK